MITRRDRHNALASRRNESPLPESDMGPLGPALSCLRFAVVVRRQTAGEHLADMPHWMGGEPAGVPPRRGTPEYDAWMAARAQEAARPKTDQPKTDQPKTDQTRANRPKADQSKADRPGKTDQSQ
jgi:hypothetical protein